MRKVAAVIGLSVALVAATVRTSDALTVSSGDAFPVGSRPMVLAKADFDRDGRTDVVTMNAGSSNASVLLSDGSGGFSAGSTPGINTTPTAMSVGDVNGDGKTDLVTVGAARGRITLLYGDGTGAFPSVTSYKTNSDSLVAVAVGDVNGDGTADVLSDEGAGVRVLLGPSLVLASGAPYALRFAPSAFAVADMNGDRYNDAVVASVAGGSVSVMRGGANGVLTLVSEHALGTRPAGMVVGDFNGDGDGDVAVAEPDAGAVELLTGDGAGNLNTHVRITVGDGARGIDAGDLNGDGKQDLVVASDTSNTVSVLLGDGAGSFVAATGSPFAVDGGPSAVAALDVDQDGVEDVAVARAMNNDVLVERNASGHELDASPADVDMGSVGVGGSSDPATVSVSSSGLASTITTVEANGDDFRIVDDACTGAMLGDGHGSCDVRVVFTPQGEGDREGTLSIADDAGAQTSVALHGVGIDTTPPETTITGGPASLSNDPEATFTFAADDPDAHFECSVDGADFTACDSPYSANVSDGDHGFAVRGIDLAGNVDPTPATASFTVDTTAPDTTITSGSADAVFTFTSDDAEASFGCSMDGAPFEACTSPYDGGPQDAGEHTFEVRATDAAGNVDPTPASFPFTVDAPIEHAPETTIVEHPDALTSDTTPTFRFVSDESGVTFRCSIDDADFTDCGSPFTTDELAEGHHTFRVAAVDGDGVADPTPDSFALTVDVTAPNTAISGPSRTKRRHAFFIFRFSEDVARTWCSVDGTGYSECRTPYSGRALRPGKHVLRVFSEDPAGNREGSPAVKRFTIVRGR